MTARPNVLDVVELRVPRGGQPAGAIGTVVELFATEAVVEVTDERGTISVRWLSDAVKAQPGSSLSARFLQM
jgi:hypothetical protein